MKARLARNLRESAILVEGTDQSLCIIPIYLYRQKCTPAIMKIAIELDKEVEGYVPNPIFMNLFVRLDAKIVFDVIETTDQDTKDFFELTYCEPIMQILIQTNCYVLKKHVELI